MCAIAEKVEQVQKQEMELRKQLAERERERDEKDRQVTRLYAKFDAVTKERDEAVDAVRKLSEGQPFNAVVAADITRRGLEQLATVTQERDELVEALKIAVRIIEDIPVVYDEEKVIHDALAKVCTDKGEK